MGTAAVAAEPSHVSFTFNQIARSENLTKSTNAEPVFSKRHRPLGIHPEYPEGAVTDRTFLALDQADCLRQEGYPRDAARHATQTLALAGAGMRPADSARPGTSCPTRWPGTVSTVGRSRACGGKTARPLSSSLPGSPLMTTSTSNLTTCLYELRRRRGLTQQELADAAGVSVDIIRKLEQGQRSSALLTTLMAIAQALDTMWAS